jgi:hypothetical protein
LGASAVWAKAVALISASVNAARVVVRIIASPLRSAPFQVAQMCVASTAKGKNENYENLREGKAPFILHSGVFISDAGSNFHEAWS